MSGISCRTCGSWEPLAAGASAGPRPGRGPRFWNPSPAVAGVPGGEDYGGSQSLCAHGAFRRAGLRGRWPAGKFLDPGKLLAGVPLSPCRPLPVG